MLKYAAEQSQLLSFSSCVFKRRTQSYQTPRCDLRGQNCLIQRSRRCRRDGMKTFLAVRYVRRRQVLDVLGLSLVDLSNIWLTYRMQSARVTRLTATENTHIHEGTDESDGGQAESRCTPASVASTAAMHELRQWFLLRLEVPVQADAGEAACHQQLEVPCLQKTPKSSPRLVRRPARTC